MADARGGRDRHPRVVLNALALRAAGSGVQTYARELLAALPAAWPEARFTAIVAGAVDLPATVVPVHRAAWVDHGLVRRLQSLRSSPVPATLVHGLDADVPWRETAPTIATVHDLALFDTPWAFPAIDGRAKRRLVAGAIRRADALIAVSAFTAERVRARFGRDSTVVHEAPPAWCHEPDAAAVEALRARYGLTGPFVLYVGNLEPRKDVAVLAAACRAADVPLVLAGGAIRTVETPAGVRRLGYVPTRDLPALYRAATVVAYVSRYEGFALPPVEAMACGAVVVATPVGALPEVVGDGADLVPVGDVGAIGATLAVLAADGSLRAERRAAALAAARALSWSRAADETVAVYRRLV